MYAIIPEASTLNDVRFVSDQKNFLPYATKIGRFCRSNHGVSGRCSSLLTGLFGNDLRLPNGWN